MNAIESMLLETMQDDAFQRAVSDDFSFTDNIIDHTDLDKINDKEETLNACND